MSYNNHLNKIIFIALIFMPFICRAYSYPNPTTQWLSLHNNARKAVGLRPLTWDPNLANFARFYGSVRSRDCGLIHSNGPYGENLYWGSSRSWTPSQAIAGWMSEKYYYNRGSNTCRTRDCGHYTQIVWRNTRRVGCAEVVCGNGAGVLFICEYFPPGNYVGERPY